MLSVILSVVTAYLAGSIPIGYIVCRLKGISDIRCCGSGNIGATNVARSLGNIYFFVVFFLDAAKAYGVVYVCQKLCFEQYVLVLVAVGLLVGNVYSIFLKFCGGKGISTSVGILFALYPYLLLISAVPWLLTVIIFRSIGMASVVAVLSLPLICLIISSDYYLFALSLFIALWCIFSHRHNIICKFGKK